MHGNDRSTSQIWVGWIDLFDDNIENIVIRIEYRLKVSTIHIVSDQWNSTEPYILIILEKKHLTEQNSIKSSNQIACLRPVRHDSTKQSTLYWCYLQSVSSCHCHQILDVPDIEDEAWMKVPLWIRFTTSLQVGDRAAAFSNCWCSITHVVLHIYYMCRI